MVPLPTHMNYSSLLNDIERGRIKIPQFQRDFVWTKEAAANLLDSIVKGYPIGTFIFWETDERLRSVKNLGGISLGQARNGEIVSFVLDGQQRLTSLYVSLKGLKIQREGEREDDFADIFVNLEAENDEQIIVTDIKSFSSKSWISLCDLLTGDFQKLATYDSTYHIKLRKYADIFKEYNFSITRVQGASLEVATEIFTRINVSGKSLTLFEIMVAKTYEENHKNQELDFDLAVKFDLVIEKLQPLGFDTIPDIIVLQLISLVLTKECKRSVILSLQKKQFIEVWEGAIDALERAVEFFKNSYRIPVSQLLPYNALLVPFAYFFYHHSDKPNAEQRKFLQDFFWRCALGERYSSAVESKLVQDIKRIDKILQDEYPSYDWSVSFSPESIKENGWFSTGRSFIKAILCLYVYFEPKSFNDNATVNIQNYWLKQANSKNYHHFFPKAYLARKHEDNFWINHILNITIVDDYLNKREIQAKAPATYIKKYLKENSDLEKAMKSHLIPDIEAAGILENDYDKFIDYRAKEISKALQRRIIKQGIDS